MHFRAFLFAIPQADATPSHLPRAPPLPFLLLCGSAAFEPSPSWSPEHCKLCLYPQTAACLSRCPSCSSVSLCALPSGECFTAEVFLLTLPPPHTYIHALPVRACVCVCVPKCSAPIRVNLAGAS